VLQISALFAAVSTCIFFLLKSQHPHRIENHANTQNLPRVEQREMLKKMLVWAGVFTAASFFMGIARPYITPFLAKEVKLSEFQIGVFGSVSYGGVTFMGVIFGRLGDKWKRSGAIGLCLLFYVAAVVPLLFLRDAASLMPVAFLFGGSSVSGSTFEAGTLGVDTTDSRHGCRVCCAVRWRLPLHLVSFVCFSGFGQRGPHYCPDYLHETERLTKIMQQEPVSFETRKTRC
jgi:predicted MFS family arabinose efflux permease